MGGMHTPSQSPQFQDSPAGHSAVGQAPGVGSTAESRGLMKAMSPGVVDFLFRQLVAGRSAEDVQWQEEGITLSAQPAGAELARRLAEIDLEALTPLELFHYVRAAQKMAAWAEGLRKAAVERYCQPGSLSHGPLLDPLQGPHDGIPPGEQPGGTDRPVNLQHGP
ncbi:hypothetical protein ABIA70_001830 [Arthrobacter sp. 754]